MRTPLALLLLVSVSMTMAMAEDWRPMVRTLSRQSRKADGVGSHGDHGNPVVHGNHVQHGSQGSHGGRFTSSSSQVRSGRGQTSSFTPSNFQQKGQAHRNLQTSSFVQKQSSQAGLSRDQVSPRGQSRKFGSRLPGHSPIGGKQRQGREKGSQLDLYGSPTNPTISTSPTNQGYGAPEEEKIDLHNKEFCVDVSTYDPVTWVERNAEACETVFVKDCSEKTENVCANVTETACKVTT